MARFTTRVELHNPKSGDYDKLHEEMEIEGFTRTIQCEGVLLQLPTAEYNREADITIEEVLSSAKRAADKVDSNNSILVTEVHGNRRFLGLKPAKKAT